MIDDQGRFEEHWTGTYAGETSALGAWKTSHSDVAAFVRLSEKWSTEMIDRHWNEIGQRPAHDDSLDQIDLLYDEIGIMPHDYDWMLRSAAIKDLVTAFEVYLDSVGSEMLTRHRYRWKLQRYQESVSWGTMSGFYRDCLGGTVGTDEVLKIRALRNILTHQRGELRTDEQREKFGSKDYSTPYDLAHLDAKRIARAADELAAVVQTTDKAVLPYIVGSDRLSGLDQCKCLVPDRP
ncbi:hypothetical protein [Nocardia jinanensis]|uniref:Uncharacterized protein n=1 Tax=Nocardia jinanensis TaxID=382504 RepID=A0A917W0F1_9NOCA|nr:hypothetical protein [Nocardia jinanensis]GGL46898.1 hypothetical protein GCM10011588_72220 [Nocardia jinanensis]